MSAENPSRAGDLIETLLKKERSSSNLQAALALAVVESDVRLPAELSHQLVAIQAAGDIPLCPADTDPEELHVRAEALRMIFRDMIIFIMAYAKTHRKDHPFEQRIKKITRYYGIKAPWEEDKRNDN